MSYPPPQVTRYHCPIGTCRWTVDDAGPEISALPGSVTFFPGDLARDLAARVEAVIRAHVESHDLAELVGEIVRLRDLVPAPVPDLTAVPWRQGRSHAANLWAVTSPDWQEHQPIGRMDSAELAAEAVAAHNGKLANSGVYGHLLWLMDMGLEVRLIPDRGRVEAVISEHLAALGTVEAEGITEALAAARKMAEEAGCGRPALG